MIRFARFSATASLFCSFFCLSFPALAQGLDTDSLTVSRAGDYAAAMLDFLFRGDALPAAFPFSGARLSPVADALRDVMGTYSLAMLVLAVFLVFYQVMIIVADTAHQGVFMGRRANQIWAPIRLIIAMLLLVPMGGGLSMGQRLVLRIATSGSNLASHAWRDVTQSFGPDFFNPVMPRGPDLSRFVFASLEMELCRTIYNQAATIPANSASSRLAGPMSELEKRPSTDIAPETWRYTNPMNADVPMCGEYRFPGFHLRMAGTPVPMDAVSHIADAVASFSHAEADATLAQARLIAGQDASSFLAGEGGPAPLGRADLLALRQALQQQNNNHMRSLAAAQMSLNGKSLAQFDEAGWISAGFFIPELVRLQASYGELADHLLPDIQEPVFAHRGLTQQVLSDTIGLEPALRGLDRETLDGLYRFYANLSRANLRAQDWLYSGEEGNQIAPGAFDLRDHVTAASDSDYVFALFAQALNDAAQSRGVWGNANLSADAGNPFSAAGSRDRYNPLTGLIEFGRRQFGLGAYLIGLAAGVAPQPQIAVPAMLVSGMGAAFVFFGAGVVFFVCLLSFGRFLLAVLMWLAELVEALVAIPLVALAHISLAGDGIAGAPARQAYLLWISLAVRPVLSLAGLLVGLLIFALGLSVVALACAPLAQLANGSGGGVLVAFHAGLTFAYDILACLIAYVAFKGITLLPDRALRWLSPFVMTDMGAFNPAPGPMGGTVTAAVSAIMQHMAPGNTAGETSSGGTRSSSSGLGRMVSLFPFYQQARTDGIAKRESAGKMTPSDSKTTAVSMPPALSSTTTLMDKNIPPFLGKDKKDRKGAPFAETSFFMQKKDADTKPEDGEPPEDEKE